MSIFYKIVEPFYNPKYSNENLNGNNTSYQKFIVLTYKRTGSNYFLDLLRSHHKIVSFGSLYGRKSPAFLYPGYPPVTCKKTLNYRNNHPIKFLEKKVFRNYSKNIHAVGFKLNYENNYQGVMEYLKNIPNLKVIHLLRRNLLRLYLSDMIAANINKWHAINKEHLQFTRDIGAESRVQIIEEVNKSVLPDNFSIELKYEDCLVEFINISNYIKKFQNCLNPDQTLVVYYEDLLINQGEEMRKVLSFLGVDNLLLTSRFVKINNKKLSMIISNYFELKKKFANSEWELFFDE